MEELSFVPSAVSDTAGWCKPRFMCGKKWRKGGFKFFDIEAILVEDEGRPHAINLCKKYDNLRLAERSEPEVTHVRWKAVIGEKSSRGKLSACKWSRNKDMGTFRSQKVASNSLDGRSSNSDAAGEAGQESRRAKRSLRCCAKVMVCVWTLL